ncbi:uncharacterized protein LY89DRAFT_742331 [Mollisia scopiformis]|uniref:Uncharacterized protein n=1 Tax=Mollisia scopiformis TaxID=149040 RepID=A0A132B8N8_MOLSC|nr:uncharacterized protein LY89DRAFT_742331 [Mollisia scopiformis]KUJ08037.1 hypothetical protein LY89DRAFT_742331 [Mollisia scopiformis]
MNNGSVNTPMPRSGTRTPSHTKIRRSSPKSITPTRGSVPANRSKIGNMLSTSKNDSPRGRISSKGTPAAQVSVPQTSSEAISELVPSSPEACTSRPRKRQKTAQRPEPIPEDISSSQSSAHSPWRRLRPIVVIDGRDL